MRYKQKKIICRMYKEGDEQGIIELFNYVFGREMTLKEWQWKYRGQGNEKVCSVVLEDKENGIVGHYGGLPLKMIYDGTEVTGIQAVDTMVHPRYRSYVRFKEMYNLFMDELIKDSKIFFGFSHERHIKLAVDRIGIYERVETVREAIKDVEFHNNPLRFLYSLHPINFEDERIDELWDIAKYQFRLAIVRNRRYLKWRYRDNPLFSYEIWGLRKRWSKKLLAVAVLRRDEGNMLIMDLIYRNGMLPILLTKVENLSHSLGMSKVFLWAPKQIHDVLRNQGFTIKPTATTLPRSTHPQTLSKEEIMEKFFYTMGDTDYL